MAYQIVTWENNYLTNIIEPGENQYKENILRKAMSQSTIT